MENKTMRLSLFTSDDAHLFKHGNHFRLYEKMGSKLFVKDGIEGVYFCIWAPNAGSVSVIGEFNSWNSTCHQLFSRGDSSGIWEGFIAGLKQGDVYKYFINSSFGDFTQKKADPFAFYAEVPDKTSSRIWDLSYDWKDKLWMNSRKAKSALNAPVSIYEVHLGSWQRGEGKSFLDYVQIGKKLSD
jgi:1,4-alpha-glucan branching enzyme